MLYGHSIAKELLSADVSSLGEHDKPESWKAEAHFTNANYQSKKTIFLLFINRMFYSLFRQNLLLKSLLRSLSRVIPHEARARSRL